MENEQQKKQEIFSCRTVAVVLAVALVSVVWAWMDGRESSSNANVDPRSFASVVLPQEGTILPIRWRDIGRQLVQSGAIDQDAFETLLASRGGFTDEERALLEDTDNGRLVITQKNAPFLLNLLWALGLANANPLLDDGPMQDPRYGGAGRFASTGGWTLSVGNAMEHYSRHTLVSLTDEQQRMVERVARHIYRPCCNNATHFPDCNHGMAMLGLLTLMASQGASEADLYAGALAANTFWFPDTYMTIAAYLHMNGRTWKAVDPKELLGDTFSSANGYQRIAERVLPAEGSGSSCSV